MTTSHDAKTLKASLVLCDLNFPEINGEKSDDPNVDRQPFDFNPRFTRIPRNPCTSLIPGLEAAASLTAAMPSHSALPQILVISL